MERIQDKLNESLAQYVLNEKELEDITPQKFARLWTMKEAVVKLTGRGITGKEQLRPLLNDYHNGKSPWQIITKDFPDYVVSIAER